MLKRKEIVIAILLVFLLAVSATSAADNATSDIVIADETTDDVVNVENDDENELGSSPGTFTDLANDIAEAEGTLNLTRNYAYNQNTDSDYRDGVTVDKTIYINGNGYTISGDNQARAFYIGCPTVVLKNISFMDCSVSSISSNDRYLYGGAVYWSGDDGVLCDCSFVNCSVSTSYYYHPGYVTTDKGGAVYWSGTNGTLSDCSFVNCSADYYDGYKGSGGAVYWEGASGTLSDCSFVNSIIYGGTQGSGGSVDWRGINGVLANCSFVNSSNPNSNGGAVYWGSSNGCLYNCTFINSAAANYYEYDDEYEDTYVEIYSGGSAVYWNGDNGILYDCRFINSTQSKLWTEYDGIAVLWFGKNGLLNNCSFVNSFNANPRCGAIYWLGASGTLSDSSFVNCSVSSTSSDYNYNSLNSGSGGAVYWSGANGVVSVCSFVNCSAVRYGGGIYFLGAGCSLINSTFEGNSAQNGSDWYSYRPLNVIKKSTSLSASKVTTVYGSEAQLIATLKDADNKVISGADVNIVLVSGNDVVLNTTLVSDEDGKVTLPVGELDPKVYYATIYFAGNNNYNSSLKENVKVNVKKISTSLTAADVSGVYHNGTRLVAILKDADGNPISNQKVRITINGKKWSFTTTSQGKIKFSTDRLDAGNYTAEITFKTTTYYYSSNITANIEIIKANTTLTASPITAVYGSGVEFVATLTDVNGNPVSGAEVNLAIGRTSTVVNTTLVTDGNGQIRFDATDLNPKVYYANISYSGDSNYNPTEKEHVKIYLKKITTSLTAADVAGVYHNGTRLVATLKDANGNPLGNEKVSFIINGKKWTFTSTSQGKIKFSTDRLDVGNYTVEIRYETTAYYYGSNTTASIEIIKVNTTLSALDVIAEYHSGTRLVATLKDADGNPLGNEKVSFIINGKKWTFTSTSQGKIKFSTDRLDVGNYTVLISYEGNDIYSPSTTTANISIYEKCNTSISVAYNVGDKQLVATLTDADGNAISNADVVVSLEGVDYVLNTDSKGQVNFSTQYLDLGKHTFNVSYAGDIYYNPTSKTASIIIQ